MSNAVALRALIEERFPDAVPLTQRAAPTVATGVAAFDQILPQGGLPRGRLTVWGPPLGAVALLRTACQAAVHRGERAVWIDAARTMGPTWQEGPILIRPHTRLSALRFTEWLLHSHGFALVVLSGAEPDATELIRFSRLVHQSGTAFVALTPSTSTATVRLASHAMPGGTRYAPGPFGHPAAIREVALSIEARASGWRAQTTLHLPVQPYDVRLSLDPALGDRRGLGR